ncbi:MAG: FHA domain-containing protein [Cyanophyceae cyanobacterium]
MSTSDLVPPFQAVLVIEGLDKPEVLQGTVYSIGRHVGNSIVISSNQISRHHATLVLKQDRTTHRCSYYIFDGDLHGNRSKNGILVNREKCSVRELQHGDVIDLGYDVKARYLIDTEYSADKKPLGAILQEAGLVSAAQIEMALRDQAVTELKLGEILALRGWLKQETVNFVVDQWQSFSYQDWANPCAEGDRPQPIGQYFKQAALLTDKQIQAILAEQQQTGLRFGSVAVLKGLLKQSTLDFFLQSFSSSQTSNSGKHRVCSNHLDDILQRRQITRQQQSCLLGLMQQASLGAAEQDKVRQIRDRLAQGLLQLVD